MVEINTPGLNYIALLIPILPLIGFLVNGLLGDYLPKSLTGWLGSLVVLGSFICSVILFNNIDTNEALRWLKRAISRGFVNYPLIAELDPFLASVRRDRRFTALKQNVKLKWEQMSEPLRASAARLRQRSTKTASR